MTEWSELNQEEKFNITRDYVRRGFHRLDDIINDFNGQQQAAATEAMNAGKRLDSEPTMRAIRETLNDWYGRK